jgi:5'-3' exonuclease
MGGKTLRKKLKSSPASLEGIGAGKCAAIDMSCWLHKILGVLPGARQHFMADVSGPVKAAVPVKATVVVTYIRSVFSMVKKHLGEPAVAVFDGRDHRLKLRKNAETPTYSEKKLKEMMGLVAKGKDGDLSKIEKLMPSATKVRVDVVAAVVEWARLEEKKCNEDEDGLVSKVVGALYEADWECCMLAQEGLVDLVLTEDSDLTTLGCPVVLHSLKTGANGSGDCQLIELERSLRELGGEFGADFDLRDLQAFSCLLGNDYCRRPAGCGEVWASKEMKKWLDGSGTPMEDQPVQFRRAMFLFKHAPVLRVKSANRKAYFAGDYTVELDSLTPLPGSSDRSSQWLAGLGWDPSEDLKGGKTSRSSTI